MKTVLITGASGNLGSTVVKEFLDKNYRVLATVTNETAKTSVPAHANLEVIAVDLTNENQSQQLIENAIQKHQTIDAALLLVGGFAPGTVADTTGGLLRSQIALNFETAFFVTRPLFAHMMDHGKGSIVFIGARPAIHPAQGKNLVAYSLSKSLLFSLAEMLNEAAKGSGVSISVVVPSTIDTPLNRNAMPEADPSDWVKPSEIAETLEFLVSDKASSLRETVIKLYNRS